MFFSKVLKHFDAEGRGGLTGKVVAFWGLAFKPRTDDIREAPALTLIRKCLGYGVECRGFDPVAADNAAREIGPVLAISQDMYECARGADALIISTDWDEFKSPDLDRLATLMRHAPPRRPQPVPAPDHGRPRLPLLLGGSGQRVPGLTSDRHSVPNRPPQGPPHSPPGIIADAGRCALRHSPRCSPTSRPPRWGSASPAGPAAGIVEVVATDIRAFAANRHAKTDDHPSAAGPAWS